MSYERSVYESVDDKSLSGYILKINRKKIMQQRVKYSQSTGSVWFPMRVLPQSF